MPGVAPEMCPPQNARVKALIPSVIIFGDGTLGRLSSLDEFMGEGGGRP